MRPGVRRERAWRALRVDVRVSVRVSAVRGVCVSTVLCGKWNLVINWTTGKCTFEAFELLPCARAPGQVQSYNFVRFNIFEWIYI